MKEIAYDRLLNIGIQLSAQRDMSKLLATIVSEAMSITNCDGGTLYLLENNVLQFKIMRTLSLGINQGARGEIVPLPPVPYAEKNICAYSIIHRRMENIADVYCSKKFDFSGPRDYDKITGYRTSSMLVIPLEDNKGEVVGVLQLINAMDKDGNIIPFSKEFEYIFMAIASQAAIAVTNMRYTKQIKELLQSFVEVLTTAIDERSHYNANHTRNVVTLTDNFITFINQCHETGETPLWFSKEERDKIIMAAWLHDVGKFITPLEVMDKATKLGTNEQLLLMRLEKIYYLEKCRYLSGELSEEKWKALDKDIKYTKEFCIKLNTKPTTDEDVVEIEKISKKVSIENGKEIPWLSEQEKECLLIRYGTLTATERRIMEDHVVITERLLSKIHFTGEYADVPKLAISHHEKLNGKGYPKGIKGEEMSMAARVLQIMDIFEALTSKDRPYKKPMSRESAFEILTTMADSGEIDHHLLMLLRKQQNAE